VKERVFKRAVGDWQPMVLHLKTESPIANELKRNRQVAQGRVLFPRFSTT
jgi:hypothetical protein